MCVCLLFFVWYVFWFLFFSFCWCVFVWFCCWNVQASLFVLLFCDCFFVFLCCFILLGQHNNTSLKNGKARKETPPKNMDNTKKTLFFSRVWGHLGGQVCQKRRQTGHHEKKGSRKHNQQSSYDLSFSFLSCFLSLCSLLSLIIFLFLLFLPTEKVPKTLLSAEIGVCFLCRS